MPPKLWDRRVKTKDKERVREEEVFVELRREREREFCQNGSVRLEREGGFNNFNDSFFSFFPSFSFSSFFFFFLGEIMAIAILVNLALNNLNIII